MLEELEQATGVLSACAAAPTWSLPEDELVACLDEVHRLEQVAAAVKLHLVQQIDGRHLEQVRQARGMARWLGRRLRLDRWVVRDLLATAEAADTHPALDAALAAGEVHPAQVRVIADAVDVLPVTVGKETLAEAEQRLLEFAGRFEPARLRKLGDRILEWVAPQVAEEAERFLLERAGERAWRRRGLTLSPPVDGAVQVRGVLPVEDAAVVRAALDPLIASGVPDGRTAAQVRADALVELCRGGRPGGRPAQLTVTVGYDPVRRELGAGTLAGGERVSPGTVRRLACDADVLPVVLDTAGRPVDVGRARRLFPGWLRRVLAARDGGCAFPECDRPSAWCEAHHVVSWLDGGVTSVDNGVLLCRGHHRLIHDDSGWQVRPGPDGIPDFIPPPHLDPLQRPRRNLFHRRT